MNMSNITNIEVGRGRTLQIGGRSFWRPFQKLSPGMPKRIVFVPVQIKIKETITDATK